MLIILPLAVIAIIIAWILRPHRDASRPRMAAIFTAVLPLTAVAAVSVIVQAIHSSTVTVQVSDISNNLFIVGLCLIAAAMLALIGFAIARRTEIVKGIGFGLPIMVIISIIELAALEGLGGV